MPDPTAVLPCPAQISAPTRLDVGDAKNGKVEFGNWRGPTAVMLSIDLDHFGSMGLEQHPASWQRLLEGGLAIGGVVLVGQAG